MDKKDKSKSKRSPFAERLVKLRKQNKLTMKALGEKLNVSESFISRLEASKRQPSREFILSLEPVFFPEGNPSALDELLILAGLSPINLEHLIEYPDSVGIHKQYLEANPYQFKAYLSLIVALIKTGKYAAAQTRIEKGLKLFQHTVQFEALMATLELSKGHYKKAISHQQNALDSFKVETNKRDVHTTIQDLLLNQAVIYFMQGDHHIFSFYEAMENQEEQSSIEKHKAKGLNSLYQAQKLLKEARDIAPKDIYILDEYARVCFNLALLSEAKEAAILWQDTIDTFLKVIHSEQKELLSHEELLQSTVYLAHAYAKKGLFNQAEHDLNLLEICLPQYWMIPYAKACLYNLKYEYSGQDRYLDSALLALQKAVSCKGKDNYTVEEAHIDPDLKTLRKVKLKEFNQIMEMENN